MVEAALKSAGGDPFVANDCDLSPRVGDGHGRIVILTGPNMGGKSTWLRQNAQIVLLAQAGAFCARRPRAHRHRRPAAARRCRRRPRLRPLDLHGRDDRDRRDPQPGRPARAGHPLDEIGRGTATFDGLSIAWGTIEHLNEVNRCRALFATHYHELTALADRLRIDNRTVKVREWKGDVVFLHEIVAGAADRSYGIQVARLAGLPRAVIERARAVLKELEEHDRRRPVAALSTTCPCSPPCALPPRPEPEQEPEPEPDPPPPIPDTARAALDALATLRPDDASRAALEELYRLKGLLAGG